MNRYLIIVILSILLHLLFYGTNILKKIDYKFYDYTNQIYTNTHHEESTSYSVIIDIDEKSIQALGQWPWPRIIDAQLINELHALNPSSIGLNILFPEQDRVSLVTIKAFYKNFYNYNINLSEIPPTLQDNDQLLAKSITNSKATLSTYFSNENYTSEHCKTLTYSKNSFSTITADFTANSLLCNYKPIQKSSQNFGFINASLDDDGIFRRTPLFMSYQNKVFPSFALATLLSFDKYLHINDKYSTILVNFSTTKPKVFSAVDILNGTIPKEQIQGKIAIIGSSVIGLNPNYKIFNGENISNSMIHAVIIDNILGEDILFQPEKYKVINLIISFLLSIIIIIFLKHKSYFAIFMLFLATFILSLFWLFDTYSHNIYLSFAYLWIPILSIFLVTFIYHIKIISHEHQEQEKLLIRQSKLASMGEMISLIAHQWRQPLSAINGVVLKLDIDHRKEQLNTKQLDKYLNEIEDITGYLSKTIHDFSSFFSTNKETNSFIVQDTITQAINLTTIKSHKKIEIILRDVTKVELKGFKSELIQALLILFNNAIYACQKQMEKGIIEKGEIYVDVHKVKNRVCISISDNGGGVESKNLSDIFNPYFTTKSESDGTGLGLYILKLIVEESMNGRVKLVNGKDGAIFTIEISNKKR